MILNPGTNFTVVRQIANHLDGDINYVQAVIRNAYTDATLDTLQLTSRGGQRFSKNWLVPVDTSGMGFYVSIVTSVYTDSGYTTKNANYGDEEVTYLIQDRVLRGGGGSGLDAFTVRKIVQEELNKLPEPQHVTMPKMRWDDVLQAIKAIPTPSLDLAPVLSAIEETKQIVAEKEVTPEADLSPVIAQVKDSVKAVHASRQQIAGLIDEVAKTMGNEIADQFIETIKADFVSKLEGIIQGTTFQIGGNARMKLPESATKPKTEAVPFDIKQLAH